MFNQIKGLLQFLHETEDFVVSLQLYDEGIDAKFNEKFEIEEI